ncbi:class II aldolase/adducin family protein [Sulfurovum sp. bin170]|uniref:class II aldolase/adducin family protein n=1 Tax=Sulfurovum sp. bin170 TaxID=2695268 RepID=UPI0013DEA2C5|nr:class II aldolase/adducin family protein [Sulfurovum sp. bin170]NEW60995.1 class II aldolase/adducin family protein [Sulfurovum sp. bin170]
MIDGIIKYNFDFQQSSPLEESQFIEIEAVRSRLLALGLIGVANGIGYGNISQRVDRDSFVITGTQTGHLKNLNANHYSLIEEYDNKKFYLKSSGAIKPSSEALTHGTIYNLSDEIGAVVHIHSKRVWRFMLDGSYLKTAVVEYGSVDMIDEVNRIFSDIDPLSNPKFVMAGHEEGVMIFGKNLLEAEMILFEIVGDIIKNEN